MNQIEVTIAIWARHIWPWAGTQRHLHAFSKRFHPGSEHIADAALGLDDAWRARIDLQLAPQPQHLDIDAAIENILVYTGGLQQLLPRERPLRGFKKGEQQAVLTLAQRDRRAVGVEELSTTPFKHPAVEPVAASLRIACSRSSPHFLTPQHGPNTGQQFPETEWLDDVIIRAEFKADDAIDLFGAMSGRDDDRDVRMGANFPQEIEPVILTQPQIKNDQTGNGPGEMAIQFGSIRCRLRRHIVIFKVSRHHFPQGRIVINDNDMAGIREHELVFQNY
jgi:hypothetical protein